MDGAHDSISRARALARAGELHAALGAYREALTAGQVVDTGALRMRVGELLARTGAPAEALESFARAAELFTESRQANNAIVAWQQALEIAPDHSEALEGLTALALEKSYRVLAADLTSKRVAAAIAAGSGDRGFELLTRYLARFPEDQHIWRAWAEQLRAATPPEAVAAELRRLAAFLRDSGEQDAAVAVETAVGALVPPAGEVDGAVEGSDHETPREDPGGLDAGDDPPLLGLLPNSGADDESADARPLAGLEPTHATEVDEPPTHALEGLDRGPGDDALGSAHSDSSQPLPLLDGLPDDVVHETGAAPDPGAPVAAAVRELERIAGGRAVESAEPANHYDLGIAYNALGLREEAAAQFAAALEGGHYPAAVAESAGEALLAAGDPEGAVRVLASILQLGGGEDEDAFVGVNYWLGRAHEALGALADADVAYRRAAAIDSDFHDLAERLDRSSGHSF